MGSTSPPLTGSVRGAYWIVSVTGWSTSRAEIADIAAKLPYFVTIRGFAALAAATSGRNDAAAWEVDRLSGDGFAAVPRDSLWVATIALLLEASAISGLAHTATLIQLLRPHQGTFVVQGLPNCWGSVDRFLGRGYIAVGDFEKARVLSRGGAVHGEGRWRHAIRGSHKS